MYTTLDLCVFNPLRLSETVFFLTEGVLHLYTIFVAEFTSTAFTYMVKESERVKQAIFKVGPGVRSTLCSFKTTLQSRGVHLTCHQMQFKTKVRLW